MSNKAKIREDAMKLNPIDDALFVKMAEDMDFCQEMHAYNIGLWAENWKILRECLL